MKYRSQFLPFVPSNPKWNYGMVIYHNRTNGPTPSSCNWMILDWADRWNADLD